MNLGKSDVRRTNMSKPQMLNLQKKEDIYNLFKNLENMKNREIWLKLEI